MSFRDLLESIPYFWPLIVPLVAFSFVGPYLPKGHRVLLLAGACAWLIAAGLGSLRDRFPQGSWQPTGAETVAFAIASTFPILLTMAESVACRELSRPRIVQVVAPLDVALVSLFLMYPVTSSIYIFVCGFMGPCLE